MGTPIDWGLARRTADTLAGGGPPLPEARVLVEVAESSERAVRAYTGLTPTVPIPEPEWVSRRQWAAINLTSLEESLAPLEERLARPGALPGPLEAPLSGALATLAGAQLGALVGYGSRRVLGQLELPLLGAGRSPRLLFVAANLAEAEQQLGAEPSPLLRWIALHEVTHAVHFASVPWLREHLRSLATELLEGAQLGLGAGELAAAARKLLSSDPRSLIRDVRSSDPLTLLAAPEGRALLARTQAAMAAIEGFAEHVMDAAEPALGGEVQGLRASVERRRGQRPPLARLLAWLLGLELKLRQYRDGKRFCDGVVELGGVAALNRAWASPDALPALEELADPAGWLRRVG